MLLSLVLLNSARDAVYTHHGGNEHNYFMFIDAHCH